MMISFKCECGNANPSKTHEYNGALGYEADICSECGRYYDDNGVHEVDDWSRGFMSESDNKGGEPSFYVSKAVIEKCETTTYFSVFVYSEPQYATKPDDLIGVYTQHPAPTAASGAG